jgi:hypothetical protein
MVKRSVSLSGVDTLCETVHTFPVYSEIVSRI